MPSIELVYSKNNLDQAKIFFLVSMPLLLLISTAGSLFCKLLRIVKSPLSTTGINDNFIFLHFLFDSRLARCNY